MPKVRVRVQMNLPVAEGTSDTALLKGLRAATLDAENLTVGLLSQPGSGRIYKRRGVVHRASAPGQPPAPDTGRLRQSVSSEVIGTTGIVSVNAEYAAALELGTEKRAPRPFISRLPEYGQRLIAVFTANAK